MVTTQQKQYNNNNDNNSNNTTTVTTNVNNTTAKRTMTTIATQYTNDKLTYERLSVRRMVTAIGDHGEVTCYLE